MQTSKKYIFRKLIFPTIRARALHSIHFLIKLIVRKKQLWFVTIADCLLHSATNNRFYFFSLFHSSLFSYMKLKIKINLCVKKTMQNLSFNRCLDCIWTWKKRLLIFTTTWSKKRSSLISTKLAENNFSFVGQNAYSCSFSCYFACAKKVFSRASNSAQNLLLSRKHDVPERQFQTVLCQCFTIDVLHVNFGLLSYGFCP